jgi:hypothetical protein
MYYNFIRIHKMLGLHSLWQPGLPITSDV